jgi:hypothetical protein
VKKRREELLPTLVRRGATLGAGATVVCGVTVGEYVFAATGVVIVSDIPAYALAAGNPAHCVGWVCACGERLPDDLECLACGSRYAERPMGWHQVGADRRPVFVQPVLLGSCGRRSTRLSSISRAVSSTRGGDRAYVVTPVSRRLPARSESSQRRGPRHTGRSMK